MGSFDPGKVGNVNAVGNLFVPFEEECCRTVIVNGKQEAQFEYTDDNLLKTKITWDRTILFKKFLDELKNITDLTTGEYMKNKMMSAQEKFQMIKANIDQAPAEIKNALGEDNIAKIKVTGWGFETQNFQHEILSQILLSDFAEGKKS